MTDVEELLVDGDAWEVTANEVLSDDQSIAIVQNEAKEEEIDSDEGETKVTTTILHHSKVQISKDGSSGCIEGMGGGGSGQNPLPMRCKMECVNDIKINRYNGISKGHTEHKEKR
ncbi:hypothetical protein J6590_058427 [Homalodisca vitripennis]|nr:hypothetical protein J6590_058427 [Homalodisca vitripennis]